MSQSKNSQYILSKGIHKYNNLMTSDGMLSDINSVVEEKNEYIHKEAYEYAKKKFIEANEKYKDYKFIEIRNIDWRVPSKCIVVEKKWPFTKKRIDLSKYWPKQYVNKDNETWTNLKINDDDIIYNYEIVYIDYVKGKVKVRSKLTQDEQWINFTEISKDIEVSDEISMQDTFIEKYQDIIK